MKVNKIEPPKFFTPITITIETREEAMTLWHILNCSPHRSLANYAGTYEAELSAKKRAFWHEFSQVFSEVTA
jgi:hypothetical protein